MGSLITSGVAPAEHLKQQKFEKKAEKITFEMLVQEWLEARRPAWSPRYARITEGRLTFWVVSDRSGRITQEAAQCQILAVQLSQRCRQLSSVQQH